MLPDVNGRASVDYDEAAEAYSSGGGDGRNRRQGSGKSKGPGGALQKSPSAASLHGNNKGIDGKGGNGVRSQSGDNKDDYADEISKVTAAAGGLLDGQNAQRRSRGQGISQSALDNAPPSLVGSRGLNHSPSSQ